MSNRYALPFGTLATLLAAAGPALAQAPTLINVSPGANALAVPRTNGVVASFSQPLTPFSTAALKVFSSQRGGLRGGGTATLIGANLGFFPTAFPFMPGETVQLTVTRAAASSTGTLAVPRVQQFTAAVEGTGRGAFGSGSTAALAAGSVPAAVVLGDIDGDGDLDALVSTQFMNSVSILLNDGTGAFAASPANATVATGEMPYGLALGDVDGDGDLDFVTTNYNNNGGSSSVRLNNGSGVFATPAVGAEVAVRFSQRALTLADLDGDGDLDLLTGTSVRLNDGTGVFTAPAANAEMVGITSGLPTFAVGDLDGDGALDMLAVGPATPGSRVDVRFNNGAGAFAARPAVPSLAVAGNDPRAVALGDVDADGDLDLLVGYNTNNSSVSLLLNNGAGLFGAESQVSVAASSVVRSMALGDVDADGDLDLLTPIGGNRVSVRLNNGAGLFSAPAANAEVPTGVASLAIALGDVDADGDLDFVVGAAGSLTSRLNQPLVLSAAARRAALALNVWPNPARSEAHVQVPQDTREVVIVNTLGQRVRSVTPAAGATEATLPLTGLLAGVYLVQAGAVISRLVVE